MVGRLYSRPLPEPFAERDWLLWHSHSDIEAGLHNAGDSHGGIDTSVVLLLLERGGDGVIAWRRHDDPPRAHQVIGWQEFLALATYRSGGGRYRLFVPDMVRHRVFFSPPERWLPKYDLGVLPHDPRATWHITHPDARKEPPPKEQRTPDPAQPSLF